MQRHWALQKLKSLQSNRSFVDLELMERELIARQEAEVIRKKEESEESEEEELSESEKDLHDSVVRKRVAIICGLLCAFLLLWVLPHHIEEVPATHQRYLDSGGLGAAVWGLCCGYLVLHALTVPSFRAKTANQTADKGTGKEDVVAVFGSYEEVSSCWKLLSPSGRVAKFVALLAQFALNVTFITMNFHSLPKRDPTEVANMAKHSVAWFEFPAVILFPLVLFIHTAALCTSHVDLPGIVDPLRNGGSFSALRALPMANPMNAMDAVAVAKTTKGLGFALTVGLMYCVTVPVAIMAVLVKLYQVDFATEKIIDQWTLFDYLAFAAFINNLAGLRGDIASGKKQAIMASRDAKDPEAFLKVWEGNLATTLQEVYGTSLGLVILATVSVEDLCQLLNPSLRPEKSPEYQAVP